MKLRCTQGSINFVDGRKPVVEGEVFEALDTLARQLIETGDAVEVKAREPQSEVTDVTVATPAKSKRGRR
mgnify:CR=1 FL=1